MFVMFHERSFQQTVGVHASYGNQMCF